MHLQNKVVAITGAGQGIGRACALGLAAQGARIVVNDIDARQALAVVSEIQGVGGVAAASVQDISAWSGAAGLIEHTLDAFGRIDGLVNNAGVMRVAHIDEVGEDDLELMMRVNIVGVIGCTFHAVRAMKAAGRGGSVVNVTSGAHAGQPNLSLYGATKGAVSSFTFGAAIDLADSGIRLNAISPIAETAMRTIMDEFRTRTGQTGAARPDGPSPANNVPLIAYLLSNLSSHVHGQVIRVDGPRLSIMTHPAICSPPAYSPEWTIEAVQAAFEATLNELRQPLGIAELRVSAV